MFPGQPLWLLLDIRSASAVRIPSGWGFFNKDEILIE